MSRYLSIYSNMGPKESPKVAFLRMPTFLLMRHAERPGDSAGRPAALDKRDDKFSVSDELRAASVSLSLSVSLPPLTLRI